MLALASSALDLASNVFAYLNTKEAKEYIDKSVELKLEIQKEEAKGYDSDDAKIETLYKRLEIIVRAAEQQLAMVIATRK